MATGWMLRLLAASLCMLVVLHLAEGCSRGARLSIKLISYKNPYGKDWSNRPCDRVFKKACEHRFTLCVDKDLHGDDFAQCSLSRLETGHFPNKNEITFDHDLNGVENPIDVDMARWPGAVRLKVRVMDIDKGPDDLVDKLYYNYHARPARNYSTAVWRQVLIRGTRTKGSPTSLTVAFLLHCKDHYYGSDCGTYCVAQDDTNGHYTCDPVTGQKVCLPGYVDPEQNCKDICIGVRCLNSG